MKRELVGVPRERVAVYGSDPVHTASAVQEAAGESSAVIASASRSGSETGVSESSGGEADSETPRPTADVRVEQPSWVQNVKNAIPVEILAVWAAIASGPNVSEAVLGSPVFEWGFVEPDVYAVLFGVMCVVTALYMWTDVESPTEAMATRRGVPLRYLKHSQYAQILLAVGGFGVWAYYLGGPFTGSGTNPHHSTYATILLPLYVGLGPKLIPDLLRKLHGVEIPDDRQRAPDEFLRAESE